MARLLPAADIGIFRIFFLYLMAIPALSCSVGMINGLFYWGGKEEAGMQSIREAGFLLSLLSGVVFLLLAIFSFLHGSIFDLGPKEAILFAFAAAPTILNSFYESATIAKGRIVWGAIFSAVFEFIRAAAMLAAVLYTRQIGPVIVAHIVVLSCKVILGQLLAVKDKYLGLTLRRSQAKEVFRYASPVSLAAIFDLVVNYSDRFILSAFLDPASFAFYMMGCLAVPPLQVFEQSVNKVLIPHMAEEIARGKSPYVAFLFKKSMRELMMIYIPAVVGMLIFSDAIVTLLFTKKYLAAALFLRIYAFSYLLLGIPYDAYFRAKGDSSWIFRNAVSFSVLSLCAVSLLAWRFGAVGALVGALLVQGMMRLRAIFLLKERLLSTFSELIPWKALTEFLLVSLSMGAISLLVKTYFITERNWFFICGFIYSLIYGVLMLRRWRFHV